MTSLIFFKEFFCFQSLSSATSRSYAKKKDRLTHQIQGVILRIDTIICTCDCSESRNGMNRDHLKLFFTMTVSGLITVRYVTINNLYMA